MHQHIFRNVFANLLYSSETGLEARLISEADDKTTADNRQLKADGEKVRAEDWQIVERISKAEKRKIKVDEYDSRLIGVEENCTDKRKADTEERMILGDDERIVGDEERSAPDTATEQQEEIPRIAPGVQFDSRNEDHRVS